MKEIADLISTSEDAKSTVKKIKEENKDKDPEETKKLTDPLEKQDSMATRELADILVSKTTDSKNLEDLLNNTLSQAQFQLDAQKTLAIKE